MTKYIILTFIVLFLSCKKESGEVKGTQLVQQQEQTNKLQKSKIILEDGSKFAEDWVELITFQNELKRVLSSDIQSVKDLELLKKLMGDVKETYPEKLKTQAIEARIKVLNTETLMLEQDLKDGFLNDIVNKKERIQKAYNVFVGQIEALILKERDYEKYN